MTSNVDLAWYYATKAAQASLSRLARPLYIRRKAWCAMPIPEVNYADVDSDLARLPGLEVRELPVSADGFAKWVADAKYPRMAYVANRQEKCLEHYVSLELLAPPPSGGVIVDVASCRSYFPDILRRSGHRVIAQDLSYPVGLHGDFLGGDASSMDLPDGIVDGMTLHCSFEHFEGTSDTAFIRNSWHLLKSGGRIVILPLYLHQRYFIETDPFLTGGNVPVDEGAEIMASFGYANRHGRHYDGRAFRSRVFEPARERGFEVVLHRVNGPPAVSGVCYLRYALVLEKPRASSTRGLKGGEG